MSVARLMIGGILLIASVTYGAPPATPSEGTDHAFDLISQELPSFGGKFKDHGVETVYLAHGSETDNAAVRHRFGDGVRILPATYAWKALSQWRHSLRAILRTPGMLTLDVDESQNRIVIGIDRRSSSSMRAAIAAAITAHHVPADAIVVIDTDPPHLLKSLSDSFNPQPGGVSIGTQIGPLYYCTAGFNIAFEPGDGFVTCSHCTAVNGEYDGEAVGSGREARDAEWIPYSGGVSGYYRYADAAAISYDYGFGGAEGIARTESAGTCSVPIGQQQRVFTSNSSIIDANNPNWSIQAVGGSLEAGDEVEKIGASTGWTTGHVGLTCVDMAVDSTHDELCQYTADFGSDGGDSGSPVFHRVGDNVHVILDGLLWGGYNQGSCSAIFSDIGNVLLALDLYPINAQ
jgi:hypothetical protein